MSRLKFSAFFTNVLVAPTPGYTWDSFMYIWRKHRLQNSKPQKVNSETVEMS